MFEKIKSRIGHHSKPKDTEGPYSISESNEMTLLLNYLMKEDIINAFYRMQEAPWEVGMFYKLAHSNGRTLRTKIGPLHVAVRHPEITAQLFPESLENKQNRFIQTLVDLCPDATSAEDVPDGMTPLHWACWANFDDTAAVFALDKSDRRSQFALIQQESTNSIETVRQREDEFLKYKECVVQILCEADRDTASIVDSYGRLPIHLACEYGTTQSMLNTLLHANPQSIDITDSQGRTPYDIVVEVSKSLGTLDVLSPVLQQKQLLLHTNDPLEKQIRKNYSATKRRQSSSKFELNDYASAHVRHSRLPTKLLNLIEDQEWDGIIWKLKECPEEAKIWLFHESYGPDGVSVVVSERYLPIHKTCRSNPPKEVIAVLLYVYRESIAEADHNGMLPLHHACMANASEVVVQILVKEYSKATNIKDKYGRLPLHIASEHGASEGVIDILLKANPVSFYESDNNGRTPLDFATETNNLNVVRSVQTFHERVIEPSKSNLSNDQKKELLVGGVHEQEEHHNQISSYRSHNNDHNRTEQMEGTPSTVASTHTSSETRSFNATNHMPETPPTSNNTEITTPLSRSMKSIDSIIRNATSGSLKVASSSSKSLQQQQQQQSKQSFNAHFSKQGNFMYVNTNGETSTRSNETTADTTTTTSGNRLESDRHHSNSNNDDPTLLYKLVESKQWARAALRMKESPLECQIGCGRESSSSPGFKRLPLHRACQLRPPPEVIRQLIRTYPQSVEVKGSNNYLPIHYACAYGASESVIRLLLMAYPSSVSVRGKEGTPLKIAECYHNGSREEKAAIIELLSKYPTANIITSSRSSDTHGSKLTPIQEVSSSEHSTKSRSNRSVDQHQHLRGEQARGGAPSQDINNALDNKNNNKSSNKIDHSAVYPSTLYTLIETGDWDGALSRFHQKPVEATSWYLKRRSDGEIYWRRLPIHSACCGCPPLEFIEALVEFFPQGVRSRDHEGRLPIHWACEMGATTDVIACLLRSLPSSVYEIDHKGQTPLSCAEKSSHPNKTSIVAYLLLNHHNMDINNRNRDKNNNNNNNGRGATAAPVPLSVISSSYSVYEDISVASTHQKSVVSRISKNSYIGDASSNMNEDYYTNEEDDERSVSSTDPEYKTELYVLIEANKWGDVIQRCYGYPEEAAAWNYRKGFNGDADVYKLLPLHRACQFQPPVNVIQLLIKSFPNAVQITGSENGWLPLHFACAYGASIDIVKLLLDAYPGSIDIRAKGGSPLELSRYYCNTSNEKRTDVIDFLSFCTESSGGGYSIIS